MHFSDKITLRAVTNTRDSFGGPVASNTDTEVWADVASVKRSEFYAAQASGNKITDVFAVHVEDWAGQTQVVFGGKTYDIVRSYQKGLGTVELMCEVRE